MTPRPSQSIVYDWDPIRLDIYCSQYCAVTRNFIQHCIDQGSIQVNQHRVKKSYRLCQWDQIMIGDLQRFVDWWHLQECAWIDLEIKLQTKDYIVIYKPKWVLSHPTSIWDIWQPSVVWFLVHRFWQIPSIWPLIRAGLVHRLDKMTDGLMICVISERWLQHFNALFREKSQADMIEQKEQVRLHKYYHATCRPSVQWAKRIKQLSYPYYIQSLVHAKIPHDRPDKMGITKILSAQNHAESDKYLDLDIEILTGRTHQIRYHLSQAGLPLIWDYLYGTEDGLDLGLTAYRLDFVDPDGYDRTIRL